MKNHLGLLHRVRIVRTSIAHGLLTRFPDKRIRTGRASELGTGQRLLKCLGTAYRRVYGKLISVLVEDNSILAFSAASLQTLLHRGLESGRHLRVLELLNQPVDYLVEIIPQVDVTVG